MQRFLKKILIEWKESPGHMPLILRGARQVGKSYLVESFAKESFKNYLVVNFEINSQYKACFDTLDPQNILMQLELISGQKIVPGETLLFLDEI